jgi:hypothetical protein
MKKLLIVILIVLLLVGCNQQQPVPRQIIILVDISGSIEPESGDACTNAIMKLAEKMERGDRLTVIPITGDADMESTGRILRFQKPIRRTAYDADLLVFSKQVQQSLTAFRVWAMAHPAARTDILGGISVALQEFAARPDQQRRALIVLSDFIEDDGTLDFKSDRRLATPQTAIRFATQAAADKSVRAYSIHARLGLLHSKELKGLSKERREAISQFWRQYFQVIGIESTYYSDGTGLLTSAITVNLTEEKV